MNCSRQHICTRTSAFARLTFGVFLATALAATLVVLVPAPLAAQDKPGTITTVETQTPKTGTTAQYEAGRKQLAAWRKQANDPTPLFVFSMLTGDETGSYQVVTIGQHWADFDKPAVSMQDSIAEYEKVMAEANPRVVSRMYEYLPEVSSPADPNMTAPAKFSEIVTFHVKYARRAQFRGAMTLIHSAAEKANWPVKFDWYVLYSGGPMPTYMLVEDHANWADFEDKPGVKSLRDVLKDSFGQAEADAVMRNLDDSVETESSEIIVYRPDLSYLPAK
ncbi:MAG: hypothetical protein ACRD4M_10680 [Candidatus Acidiferrales bacterium]